MSKKLPSGSFPPNTAGMFSRKRENCPPDRVLRTANVSERLPTAGQPVDTNKSQRDCGPSDNSPPRISPNSHIVPRLVTIWPHSFGILRLSNKTMRREAAQGMLLRKKHGCSPKTGMRSGRLFALPSCAPSLPVRAKHFRSFCVRGLFPSRKQSFFVKFGRVSCIHNA